MNAGENVANRKKLTASSDRSVFKV